MRRLLSFGVVLVLASGCGPRVEFGNVSGEVTYNGRPLPNGRIAFICGAGDKPVLTAEIADGRYELANVPAGPVEVTVETFNLRADPVPGGPPPNAVPKDYKFVKIPPRYGSAKDSGLGFNSAPGNQTQDFKLTP